METFLVFFGDHPVLGCIILWTGYCVAALPFPIINRYFRTRNIKNAGWPPAHLDADGDAVEKEGS